VGCARWPLTEVQDETKNVITVIIIIIIIIIINIYSLTPLQKSRAVNFIPSSLYTVLTVSSQDGTCAEQQLLVFHTRGSALKSTSTRLILT
jgi:hypothetical protein